MKRRDKEKQKAPDLAISKASIMFLHSNKK